MISVILPFYNAVSTLQSAVDSLFRQTDEEWEGVLIDDGSTDGSSQLAKSLAEKDSRIQVVSVPHRGIVSALQEGIQKAKGTYLARMDADDTCLPTRFEKQRTYLESHPDVDLVACQVTFGGDRETQAGYAGHVAWLNNLLTHQDHFHHRFVDATVAHPSVMWRREAIENFGTYRQGDFPEDFELWLRWFQGGARFAKIPEELLLWQDFPQRLSRTNARYAAETFYTVKCHYLQKVLPKKRPVYLWGAGRVTRKRFVPLEKAGKSFKGFIDVDEAKIGQRIKGRPVIGPDTIPEDAFILLGVANHGVREQAITFLENTGRQIGKDFLPVA